MLKILWPLCMLKVSLCWWLVASAGVNKQGFMFGRCPDFGRDTGTGNTLCRVSSTPLTTLAPSAYKQCLALPPHHAQYHAPAPGATPRHGIQCPPSPHHTYLFLVWMLFISLNCFKHCLHFHTLLLIVFKESILPLWYIYLYLCFVTYLFSNRRRIGRNRPEIIFEGRKPLIRRSEVMSKWWRVL